MVLKIFQFLFLSLLASACLAQTPATPTFSPAAGSFASTIMVTVSSTTAGVSIYCTTDGSTPTVSSPLYASAIFIAATATVKCIANGYSLTITPANQTIRVGDQLQFTATDNFGNNVTALGSTTWATSNSGVASLQGQGLAAGVAVGQITISASSTTSGTSSSVGSAAYTITTSGRISPPFISPSGGNFYVAQSATITSISGATIYYTTDGSQPTTGSPVYSSPIPITSGRVTIKAFAAKTGMLSSGTAISLITIFPQGTITPAANVSGIMF